MLFYGGVVTSVVVLFSLVARYGETHLQAPRAIDGRYPLSAIALPGCLSGQSFVLTVHQSGVYLTGSLLPEDASPRTVRSASDRPPLNGHWTQQQVKLHGAIAPQATCRETVQLVAQVHQPTPETTTLTGTLTLGPSGSPPISFSAQRQKPSAESTITEH
jgi:hypothetical protein